jgi:hypothetical protein
MAKTWRRLPAKARQQLSDERLICVGLLRAFRTSESESEIFGLWKPFGLGLSVFVCLRIYTVKKSTFHKKYWWCNWQSAHSGFNREQKVQKNGKNGTKTFSTTFVPFLPFLGQGVGKSRFLKSESEFRTSVWVRVRRNGRVQKALGLLILHDGGLRFTIEQNYPASPRLGGNVEHLTF